MRIQGIDGLSLDELDRELDTGGRFVVFESCISLVLVTLRRPSDIHFLRGQERGFVRGLPYTLVSLLLGWWGLPWGVIYTPLTLITNCRGGRDVTAQVWPQVQQGWAARPS